VEQQAAARGEALALVEPTRQMPYRELNHRANALARCLIAGGFRRGSRAIVTLDRSAELAITLLGVLKAGGAYAWLTRPDRFGCMPTTFSFAVDVEGAEERYVALEIGSVLAEAERPSSNLPIVTRGSDAACVLPNEQGQLAVVVPHETIVALKGCAGVNGEWGHTAGAFELWAALMAGATISISGIALESAA
jgi:non-ribosomal peptide synthetase component F